MPLNEQTTRQRTFNESVDFPGIFVKEGSGPWIEGRAPSRAVYKGAQKTVSIGHRKNRKGRYDSGGPFFTCRFEPDIGGRRVTIDQTSGFQRWKYAGPIVVPIDTSGHISGQMASTDTKYLDPIGATAISIVDPTNANADLAVSLGEIIHDRKLPLPGIPTWENRTKLAKAAGSEYLNAVFGWKPLVEDMKNVARSVKDGNRVIENYKAASGTLVHREFAFDDIVSDSEEKISDTARAVYSTQANIPAFNAPSPAPLYRQVQKTTKRWFSGSFTYAATNANSVARCLGVESEADKLFGLSLTPDTVWNLAPWSWAIDWFSNTGDVISNATSFGLAGLVMKYGYIMEETSEKCTYFMPYTGLKGVNGSLHGTVTKVTKVRREANPFGFGLSWEGLSPTQLAITAALGITRLR